MVFEIQGEERLDAAIKIRLTTKEKAKLAQDAEIACLSMSELVRRQFFNRNIVAKVDWVMINELRKVGGLLKHVHNTSNGEYSNETAQALHAIKIAIDDISKHVRDKKNDRKKN